MSLALRANLIGSAGTGLGAYTPEVGSIAYDDTNVDLDGNGKLRIASGAVPGAAVAYFEPLDSFGDSRDFDLTFTIRQRADFYSAYVFRFESATPNDDRYGIECQPNGDLAFFKVESASYSVLATIATGNTTSDQLVRVVAVGSWFIVLVDGVFRLAIDENGFVPDQCGLAVRIYTDTYSADGVLGAVEMDNAPRIPAFTSGAGTSGTNLDALTPEIGDAWTVVGGEILVDGSNRLYPNAGSDYVNDTLLASADYDVCATVRMVSDAGEIAIGGRAVGADYYVAQFRGNEVELGKWVSSSYTSLGTWAWSPSTSTDYSAVLRFRGTTVSVWVDGVQRISVTDSSLTAAGVIYIGGVGASSSTGWRWANIYVDLAPRETLFLLSGIAADNADIDDLTPEIGSPVTLAAGNFTVTSDRLRATSVPAGANLLSPSVADYEVGGVIRFFTDVGGPRFGLRSTGSAYYFVVATATVIELYYFNGTTSTQIGSTFSWSPSTSVDYRLYLRVEGTRFYVVLENAVIITGTDANLAGAGAAGIIYLNATIATTGWHMSSLYVATLLVHAPSPPQTLRPDGTVSNTDWTPSDTTAHGDTSDSDDATHIEATADNAEVVLALEDPDPALGAITSLVVTVRAYCPDLGRE